MLTIPEGQNLLPFNEQIQYNDMWILTLPAFQWLKVSQGGQSVPQGRSGASCNIWDGQMVMVGGYLGEQNQLTCEYPATYVFNLSSLSWQTQFTALSSGGDGSVEKNPFNQQSNQKTLNGKTGGLEGSFGYEVPAVVYEAVGGDKYGGATITKPIQTPTAGPMKTGSPITYTVTGPNGAVITEFTSGSAAASESSGGGTNVAAIVVGVVCGVLFVIVCYLLFCLYLYRKQLQLYKRHVEMSQAQARGEKTTDIPGLWATDSANGSSNRGEGSKFLTPAENSSQAGSSHPSGPGHSGHTSSTAAAGDSSGRRSSTGSSTEDLLAGHEPTFVGVMLNPRRSLRVINRD